jgi:hypothetical protein
VTTIAAADNSEVTEWPRERHKPWRWTIQSRAIGVDVVESYIQLTLRRMPTGYMPTLEEQVQHEASQNHQNEGCRCWERRTSTFHLRHFLCNQTISLSMWQEQVLCSLNAPSNLSRVSSQSNLQPRYYRMSVNSFLSLKGTHEGSGSARNCNRSAA